MTRRLRPRERLLTLVVVIVVTLWIVLSRVGEPLWSRLTTLGQQREVSQKKIARLQGLIRRKPSIEAAALRYAIFRSDEPDELLQRAFLDELEHVAGAGNLQVSLKPRPIERQAQSSRLGVELEVDATQDALFGFLDRLLSSPNLIELDRLRISTTASKDAPLRAILVINKIVLKQNPS